MNFFRMMNRWIMIKKHTLLVVLICILISSGIWLRRYYKETKKDKSVKALIFEGPGGWGYDILVNDSLFIHQEYIPVIDGKEGFPTKEQAENTAQLIINKMNNGHLPTVTTFELEKIFSLNESQDDQRGRCK